MNPPVVPNSITLIEIVIPWLPMAPKVSVCLLPVYLAPCFFISICFVIRWLWFQLSNPWSYRSSSPSRNLTCESVFILRRCRGLNYYNTGWFDLAQVRMYCIYTYDTHVCTTFLTFECFLAPCWSFSRAQYQFALFYSMSNENLEIFPLFYFPSCY